MSAPLPPAGAGTPPAARPVHLGDPIGPFSVAIHEAPFDLGVEVARLRAFPEVALAAGAVATFLGTVRAAEPGAAGHHVEALTLEHYPGMTERAIAAMIEAAQARFSLLGARIVHRVGRLGPGEPIVLVATASSHRRDAFESCEFLMDYLKTQAPFWKKEATPQGERWVDARVEDDQALARWGVSSANAATMAGPTSGSTPVPGRPSADPASR